MTKYRVILIGCGDGICKSLNILKDKDDLQVVAIIPRIDQSGKPFNSDQFITLAKDNAIRILETKNINKPEFVDTIKKFNVDLLCNWGHGQLFRENLRTSAKLGCINLHSGLLPFGRGSGAVQGEVMNGARKIGQTCHLMDDSFDMGVIVNQRSVDISGMEYLDEINALLGHNAPEFFVDSIYKCLHLKYDKSPLTNFGRYYPKFAQGDDIIDWNQPSLDIIRKVRSRSPFKLSKTYFCADYREIFVKEISESEVDNYIFVTGQIIDINLERGILVKTGDNAIWVNSVSYDEENYFVPSFKIGTTFITSSISTTIDIIHRVNLLEKLLAQKIESK